MNSLYFNNLQVNRYRYLCELHLQDIVSIFHRMILKIFQKAYFGFFLNLNYLFANLMQVNEVKIFEFYEEIE